MGDPLVLHLPEVAVPLYCPRLGTPNMRGLDMTHHYPNWARRLLLAAACLPMFQLGGCTAEFFSSAVANQAGLEVAGIISTSVETVLFNFFGV